jgi:gliding motility-associated-like protein
VTVTATCSDVDTVTVFVNPLPLVSLNATLDSICPGTTTQLVASGGIAYAWSSNPYDPSLAPQDTLPAPVVSPGSQTLYTVTVTNIYGCQSSAMQSIAIRPIPSSEFSIDFHSLCVGASTLIHYNGNGYPSATYNWDFGGGLAAGSGMGPYSVHWDTPGFHVVSLDLVQNGCPGPLTKDSVFIIAVPEVSFTSDVIEGCPPLEVKFSDQTLYTSPSSVYEWYFGNGDKTFLQNPEYTYNKSGIYAVTLVVTNAYACADSLTIPAYIHVFEVPDAAFVLNPKQVSIFDPLVKFNDRSLGFPVAWHWDFGDGTFGNLANLTHNYADTGTFQVSLIVENTYGCTDTAYNQVVVYPDNTLFVPNAFTPNGDGDNDIFRAYGVNVNGFEMKIFNRWGEMIFASEDIEIGWDGTYKGSPLQAEVYTVVIYYKDALGAPKNFYNKVLLVR